MSTQRSTALPPSTSSRSAPPLCIDLQELLPGRGDVEDRQKVSRLPAGISEATKAAISLDPPSMPARFATALGLFAKDQPSTDIESAGSTAESPRSRATVPSTDTDGALHVMMPDLDPYGELGGLMRNGGRKARLATEQVSSDAAEALASFPGTDQVSGLEMDPLKDTKKIIYYPDTRVGISRGSAPGIAIGQRLLANLDNEGDQSKACNDPSLASSLLSNAIARSIPSWTATTAHVTGLKGPLKGTRIINTADLWRATEYMPHLQPRTSEDGSQTLVGSDGREVDIEDTFEQIIQFRPAKLAKSTLLGLSAGCRFVSSTEVDLSGKDSRGKASSKYRLSKGESGEQVEKYHAADFFNRLTLVQAYAKVKAAERGGEAKPCRMRFYPCKYSDKLSKGLRKGWDNSVERMKRKGLVGAGVLEDGDFVTEIMDASEVTEMAYPVEG